jgi:hypothetical protein
VQYQMEYPLQNLVDIWGCACKKEPSAIFGIKWHFGIDKNLSHMGLFVWDFL